MRLNAVPFLLLPGIALMGYVIGRWSGVAWALVGSFGLLAVGTLVHLVVNFFSKDLCIDIDPGANIEMPTVEYDSLHPELR